MNDFNKFDIILADFNPRKGHAQAGVRPALVVQSNALNKFASTLIVVPFTTTERKVYPSQFLVQASKINGLTQKSRFLGNQMITLDKTFVCKKLGHLEEKYHPQVKEALAISLDWEDDF